MTLIAATPHEQRLRWQEPARSAPRAWGPYELRYLLGLGLIITGALLVTSAMSLSYFYYESRIDVVPAAIGYLTFFAGWLVFPAVGWRRAVAGSLATFALWLLTNSIDFTVWSAFDWPLHVLGLGFNPFGWAPLRPVVHAIAYTSAFTAWLVVRQRDRRAFALLAPVFLSTILVSVLTGMSGLAVFVPPFFSLSSSIFSFLPSFWLLAAVMLTGVAVLIVLPAWVARWTAPAADRAVEKRRLLRADLAARAGRPVPPDTTNPLAIAALCCVPFVALLGIILGHVALGQISRSGERGRGMAFAALILGYGGIVLLLSIALIAGIIAAVTGVLY